MIGDGWDDEPSVRPGASIETPPGIRRIAIVTGTRAEFGLLEPVMRAVMARADELLFVVAAGTHLISPAETYRDIKAKFAANIADVVPMQIAGKTGRAADVEALGKGIARFGRGFERIRPDWIVVLGDRIEAFAAASAAAVGGFALAHIHGGDRAEGVADESMRHAITKLAHLHFAATEQSAERIRKMGERPEHVFVTGSPAIDGLAAIPVLPDPLYTELGAPDTILLMHPVGRSSEREESTTAAAIEAILSDPARRVLALNPNFDPGRDGVLAAITAAAEKETGRVRVIRHIPREQFVGLLKKVAARNGLLIGNSSAALIEAAAVQLAAVDIGPRQAGRERAGNVITAAGEGTDHIAAAVRSAQKIDRAAISHPYGDGRSATRIAAKLSEINPHEPRLLRKRCAY